MNPRALALSLALMLPVGTALSPDTPLDSPRAAEASTAILASLESLVHSSTFVVVATAGDKSSVWEDGANGRRIVTYTKLSIERAVMGSPGAELWVRTLGGAVGSIGQSVSGEAEIATGSRALIFLRKVDGAVVVTAMAQGHFPILPGDVTKGTPQKLGSSPNAGTLLPRRGPSISARERLVGVTLDEAIAAVKQVPRGTDEKNEKK